VLYSTLFAATGANSRTLADFLNINQLVRIANHRDRLWWVRLFCIIFPFGGLALHIAIGNPSLMVSIGGIIQAVTLPLIATAAVFMRYRRTDQRITSGWLWDGLLWLSMFGLIGAAAYGGLDGYQKLTEPPKQEQRDPGPATREAVASDPAEEAARDR
jgi:hypothetical protein